MGYRSNGCFLVYGDALALDAFWAVWKPKFEALGETELWQDVAIRDERDGGKTLSMEYSNLKWYPEFAEVSLWASMMKAINDTHGLAGESIRIGEEYDDIERLTYGDCEYRINVSTGYSWD